jgi:1,4-dihydroxy-2-naphthoyl-CoA hydrolase
MSQKYIWFKKDIAPDQVNVRGRKTLVEHLDIQITEVGPDFLKGDMPVDERTVQPLGLLHGGASCVLAESLGSIAANMVLDNSKFVAVGQSINASHVRSATDGRVSGVARALHLGRTSQVWEIMIHNKDEKLVCVSRLTMAVIEKR